MRWLKNLMLVMSILASIGASVQNAAVQVVGKLEMRPKPIVLGSKVKRVPHIGLGTPCCPEGKCCHPPVLYIKNVVKDVKDLAIFIPGQSSAVVLEEAYLAFYSVKTSRLLFQTTKECEGCGSGLGLKPGDKETGYLLTLDKAAAAAAKKHFVTGNIIRVHLRTKEGKGTPDPVYFVNVRSVSR